MAVNTTSSPSSSYSSDSRSGFPFPPDRPNFYRQDTNASVLEYYTSSLANLPNAHTLTTGPLSPKPRRQLSAEDSASQYSTDEEGDDDDDDGARKPSVVNRRPSNPSKGARDRRRLHIVQMQSASEGDGRVSSTASDTGHDRDLNSRNSLRVRRGIDEKLHGLALVAPPDATTPTMYKNVVATTPLSAPFNDVRDHHITHKRSESEVAKHSRHRETTRQSAKGTPSLTTNSGLSSLVTTPEIGQEKQISTPVAPPVIVRLGSDTIRNLQPSSSPAKTQPSPLSTPSPSMNDYLHYEPGFHARAGRLPTPPEPSQIFAVPSTFSQPPPRPPRMRSPSPKRDISAIKQALQLPPSVTAKLQSPSSSPQKESPTFISSTINDGPPQPSHRREAAFSPSVFLQHEQPKQPTTPTVYGAAESVDYPTADVGATIRIVKAAEDTERTVRSSSTSSDDLGKDGKRRSQQMQRKGSWVDMPPGLDEIPTSPPLPPITPSMVGSTPSPPPKSFRNLPSNMIALRRDGTLPRTPSNTMSIMTALSDLYPPNSPSPPVSPKVRSNHRRIKEINPRAMIVGDVVDKKTSLERSVGYADKINELYMYDCGLGDWLSDVGMRGRSQEALIKPPQSPISSTGHTLILQRQLSRSSLTSEATFPVRPDASAATDLTKTISNDISPPSAPPLVPYPSLAPNQRAHSSRSSVNSPASSLRSPMLPSNKATAFFASLGRKSSGKKEKSSSGYLSSSSSSGRKVLTKVPKPEVKPVVIQAPTVVPGGPRAAPGRQPGRQQRSQTIMISSPIHLSDGRGSVMARRPSLFTPAPEKFIDLPTDPAFAQQVDKLQDLLPHADRNVLAGYLRRSGHDMLAIGQYLEDERKGAIKTC